MIEWLFDGFIGRALLAGMLLITVTAPMGCFVIWQRMAFFGDALAHSAMLGLALGLLLGVSLDWSLVVFCLLVAMVLVVLQSRNGTGELSQDTRLGVIAHCGLASGLVLLAFAGNTGFDLHAYLFGDVLTVTRIDLMRMLVVALLVGMWLIWRWRQLLFITICADIAQVEGLAVRRLRLVFTLLLALVVATAIQIVGVLLTASLLVVPAAAARRLATTPEQMVLFALLLGLSALFAGIVSSMQWDLPAGPAIVVAAAFLFAIAQLFKRSPA